MGAVRKIYQRRTTSRDKDNFIDIVAKHTAVVESRKSDHKTFKAKRRAWALISQDFNALSETGSRSIDQLKALYKILKDKTRQDLTNEKIVAYQPITMKVLACMHSGLKAANGDHGNNGNDGNDGNDDDSAHSTSMDETMNSPILVESTREINPSDFLVLSGHSDNFHHNGHAEEDSMNDEQIFVNPPRVTRSSTRAESSAQESPSSEPYKHVMQNIKVEMKKVKLNLLKIKEGRAQTKLAMLNMEREMMEIELAKKRKISFY